MNCGIRKICLEKESRVEKRREKRGRRRSCNRKDE